MKILTILSGLDSGGVENILLNYYRCMNRDLIKIDIIVHSKQEGMLEKEFRQLGCKIYHVCPKKEGILKNYRQIRKILKENKYDIVHTRMNYRGFTQIIAAFVSGVKIRIVHNHQAGQDENCKKIKKIFIFLLKKLTCCFSTHWMACSEVAAIEMFGKKNFKKGKVLILRNAIDLDKYRFNQNIRDEYRKKFKITDKYVIGVVARFHEQKNYDFIIEIFKKVLKQKKDSILLLVGTGELYTDIKNKVDLFNINDNVIFTGARKDVAYLMQAMDIFILPSKYEGFGNVFIEAQATGLHTLASAEGVPKTTKLTNLIEYISLYDIDAWVNKILEYTNDYVRIPDNSKIAKAGYGVYEQANILQDFYIKCFNRSKN